jgi:hypothetical protein
MEENMALAFSRMDIDEILSKLEKADGWLKSKGIDTTKSRFTDILNLTRIILDHQKRNDIQKLLNANYNEQLKYVFALIEGLAFAEIWDAFKEEKNHILHKSKLKKMISGQFFSWDDPPIGDNARNTQFELETAAKFKKVGMGIVGLDDVDFVFEGVKFNVQCKRLHSQERVSTTISEGADQLCRKMESGTKGIICLSIDKLLRKEEEKIILPVKDKQEIGFTLGQRSDAFTNNYRALWQNLLSTNILGILIFVHMVARMKEEPRDLLTTCRNIDLVTMPQNNLEMNDRDLVKKLANKIGATREL